MKVIRKKSNPDFRFGDLNIGTVFTLKNAQLFWLFLNTKMPYLKIDKNPPSNAFSLELNCIVSIELHEEVITIDGAFVEGAE